MGVFTKLFLSLVVIIIIVGGGTFIMTWDIPPPTATFEITIPDDLFSN